MSPVLRFTVAFVLLAALVFAGVIGYASIEGWNLSDSLYMTFITLTTVGFEEVFPLSPQGKHFTIVFLVFSIATVGYSVSTVIAFIFEGQMLSSWQERRRMRQINRIKDHFIVCGCGDVGLQVALELQRARVRFLVIDRNPVQEGLAEDLLYIQGDAIDDEILLEAGIQRAAGLVSALPNDEDNVFVVLSARQLNPDLTIVAKAVEERTRRKLLKAGANRIMSPYQIAGKRMASAILRPSVVDFLDVMVESGDMAMAVEEVRISGNSPLIGQTLRESGIGRATGALIVAIQRAGEKTRMNTTQKASLSSIPLEEKDVLIALGSDDQLKKLRDFAVQGVSGG